MAAPVEPPEGVCGQVVNDHGVGFLTPDAPEVAFGRGSGCTIRFGHEPEVDTSVSRVAGRVLVVCDDRLAVENLSAHIAFDIKCPDRPLETVRPGALFAPPEDRFEIRYAGSTHVHLLRVRSYLTRGQRPRGKKDATTTPLAPVLTARQWEVLDAYTAPLRAGRTAPATHAEVARALGWSMSLIRLESNDIWTAFLLGGIPMRDFPDKRDAVVDAAIRHRLERTTTGATHTTS